MRNGIIHSLGPGHGKLLVSAYFIKEKAGMKELSYLSIIISVVHNVSAAVIGFLFALIINTDSLQGQNKARRITMLISGIIVMVLGIYFIVKKFIPEKNRENGFNSDKINKFNIWTLGVSAGIVPCPLSIGIIFFGFFHNLYTVTILSVIGMSVGMGIAEFIVGYVSIKIRSGFFKFFKGDERKANLLGKIAGILGSVIIFIFGFFLFTSYFV